MEERKKEIARVVSQESLADGIYSMWIQTEASESAKPGQFLSLYTNDASRLLPRPISICEIDREKGRLRVVYRVTGQNTGTEQFSRMSAGDRIPVVGPLGNGFPVKEAIGKRVFLMGGGSLSKTESCTFPRKTGVWERRGMYWMLFGKMAWMRTLFLPVGPLRCCVQSRRLLKKKR